MAGQDYFSKVHSDDILSSWKDRTEINKVEHYFFNNYLKEKDKKVLEAGTGGGLLSFYLEDQGFIDICAYDIIPEMIQTARTRAKKKKSTIEFELADASELWQYGKENFDYLIYLGQIFCMIPKGRVQKAFDEAYRVAKSNGILICSFMDWHARWYNPLVSLLINAYRVFTGENWSKYYLPQLKLHGRINYKKFFSKECNCYWPTKAMIIEKLEKSGFTIESYYKEEELTLYNGSAFYIVCRKQQAGIS